MINLNQKKGFTLMEILLYMTIASGILFAIISFSMQIMEVSKKSSDMQEIENNIEYISNKLSLTIQTAASIDDDDSNFDDDIGTLILNMSDIDKTPTIFYLEDEAIYLDEGGNTGIKMNSDFTKCTQLRFAKVETVKSSDQVIIDMQCEPINSDLAALKQSLSIHTTISLRR